jgi:hypothetical protein
MLDVPSHPEIRAVDLQDDARALASSVLLPRARDRERAVPLRRVVLIAKNSDTTPGDAVVMKLPSLNALANAAFR